MRHTFIVLYTLLLLTLGAFWQQSQAQTSSAAKNPAAPLTYEPAKEVTLSGAAIDVLPKASAGMVNGAHLLIGTSALGTLDVSLGTFGLTGPNALAVEKGEPVEVTGVIRAFNDRRVVLARVVRVAGREYHLRTRTGIPISPEARQREKKQVAAAGEKP